MYAYKNIFILDSKRFALVSIADTTVIALGVRVMFSRN